MSRPASRLTNVERLAGGDDGRVAARVGQREVALPVGKPLTSTSFVRGPSGSAAGLAYGPAFPPW